MSQRTVGRGSRYLLTAGHGGGGKIGVFEAPALWGPWRTIDYRDGWLGMTGGDYLGIGFPIAWMSADGRTLWAVFSCYGLPACGTYHDRYNLMQATMTPAVPGAAAIRTGRTATR